MNGASWAIFVTCFHYKHAAPSDIRQIDEWTLAGAPWRLVFLTDRWHTGGKDASFSTLSSSRLS
jgi:hypothetical protein